MEKNEFQILDAYETLEEMKILLEKITFENMGIDGTHKSNFLPLFGYIEKDKNTLIDQIDSALKNKDQNLIDVPYKGLF